MLKFRRMLGLCLALAMLISTLPMMVFAEEIYTPTGPGLWYGNFTAGIQPKTAGTEVYPTDAKAITKTQEYSNAENPSQGAVKLYMPPSAKVAWEWPAQRYRYNISNASDIFTKAGKYKIHFNYKVDKDVKLMLRWSDMDASWLSKNSLVETVSSQGIVSEWTEFTSDVFTLTEAPDKANVSMRFYLAQSASGTALPAGTVADGVTTYSDADMTSVLIDDIWFEYSADNGATYTEYYPIDHYAFRPVTIAKPVLEDVEITGTKAVNKGIMVYFDESPSSVAASYNVYVDGTYKRAIIKGKKAVIIDGLTNGQEYEIKITALDEDGNETEGTTIKATPSHNGFEYAHTGWRCNGSFGRLDYVTKHGGKASLFVSDNLGEYNFSQVMNIKMGTTGLTTGDKVKFKFWAKANNASKIQVCYPEWGGPRYTIDASVYGTTFDWTQFETGEYTVDTTSTMPYMDFILDGHTDELWIDDIQMFKLDTTTNEYIEITDDAIRGDYNIEAYADNLAPANVTEANAYDEKDRGTVRVTYTEPTDADFIAVNIYNGSELVKTAAKGEASVLVENVGVGENTLTIKSVDYAGNESAGVNVTVTVEDLSYVTSDYSITENILTSAKTANTAASMSVTVTNINEENLTGILICGVYKDDTLVEVFLSEQKNIPVGNPVTLSKDFTVSKFDNDGEYEIKLFLWDALTGLKALKTSKTISE